MYIKFKFYYLNTNASHIEPVYDLNRILLKAD